jgi:hypothetical protein
VSSSLGGSPESPAKAAATGFGRAALNTAIFIAALVGACSAIRVTLPFPEVIGVYQKWLYFNKHKDSFDVLFLGSSRFYHQVIPKQFDGRVEELCGHKLRTFNFGYDAMWPPESFWMLRKLLASKPAKLRWVFIDCMDIQSKLDERNFGVRRLAYWHDWHHTVMAWKSVIDSPGSSRNKWSYLTGHGTLLMQQWTNQGWGAEWVSYELGVQRRKKASRWEPPEGWRDTEGYEVEKDVRFTGPEREKFVRNVEKLRENFPPRRAKPSFVEAVREIAADVRAAGAQPIFVITPTVDRRENFSGLPADVPVWRYHDVAAYPELYDPENHYDASHLNGSGARIFTELLAKRFTDVLKGGQP